MSGRAVRSLGISLAIGSLLLATTGCAPDPPTAAVGIRAAGCRNRLGTGSGVFVHVVGRSEPLVLTSAHVVKGATEIAVTRGGVTGAGRIVAFDPEMDLAYLAVAGLATGTPATVDSGHVAAGDLGRTYLFRDGHVTALPVSIVRRVNIRTEDIYIQGETLRPGYELQVDIDAGDSGGAVVVDGTVVGIVWARSRLDEDRAYAIDPVRGGELVRAQLRTGIIGDDIDLTRC